MKLSIIIVNWNTAKLLKQCLDNLESEIKNSKFETEIIVVDNGSSDDSVKEVKNFKLEIIENGQNLGFAKAVNKGIKLAKSEAILLLNSDTIVKKEALKNLIEFENLVRPAVVGARMLNPDGTVQGSCFCLPTVKRAILEYWLKKKNYFSKYAPAGFEPIEVEAVSGGAMLISRALIDKIGMLDERYFMYFEDLDFCRRARASNLKIYYLPSAEVIHEHGASGKKLVADDQQWKRLIPSSKIYHGIIKHYLINFIIWSGQKLRG
ncbi:MAG: glycosyltransferase family 2 protein [Nanoarchaeota archaeon]|nr:glycosyltransferase family 2 protein [Nanoarchaeota archaeon]